MRANNVLLILFLFILSVTGVVYAGVDEYVDIKKYGCQNLHEVQSGEDALRQLYDNLNTDCFLNIPDIELEKIWGIKVTDFDDPNSITKNMSTGEFLKWLDNKPVVKGKMADKIYAEFEWYNKNRRYNIKLRSTTGLFNLLDYNDHFPYNLPYPNLECDYEHYSAHSIIHSMPYDKVNYGIYIPQCQYIWEKRIKGKRNRLQIDIDYPLISPVLNSYSGMFKSFNFSIDID